MKTLEELNLSPLVAVVDIETASKKPTAAILSVGCVLVDVFKGVEVARFYSRCDMDSQLGRDQDTDTLNWWDNIRKDHPEAYDEAFCIEIERSPLDMVLSGLDCFLATYFGEDKRQVMGNGPEFDNVILANAYEQMGLKQPWHYGGNQSLRTVVLMGRLLLGIDPKYDLEFEGVRHHALYDALHEARYLLAVFGALFKAIKDSQQIKAAAKQLDKLINNQVVTMQSAYIEAAYGKGPEAGMQWIANSLFGPGFIPSDEEVEKYEKSAQLFYNANCSDPLGPCAVCERPSGWAGAGVVACCEEHLEQGKKARNNESKAEA
ncbi:3'-5' exonuclease [Vibrio parahaemolyticus]